MGKGRDFLEGMITQSSLAAEAAYGLPVVEITGDKRVLIEGHHGVIAYSRERILVGISYGTLCICGCNLEMMHMTREHLVIRGRIDSVHLHRRESS